LTSDCLALNWCGCAEEPKHPDDGSSKVNQASQRIQDVQCSSDTDLGIITGATTVSVARTVGILG